MQFPVAFANILNVGLEDVKTSLGVLTHGVDLPLPRSDFPHDLQYEIVRAEANINMVQHCYYIMNEIYHINKEYIDVDEFLEEQNCKAQFYAIKRGVQVSYSAQSPVKLYADAHLLSAIVAAILASSVRYAREHVELTVLPAAHQPGVIVRISDDGKGYPASICGEDLVSTWDGGQFLQYGRLGMLLHYALLTAQAHSEKSAKGNIYCANGGRWGGGVFTLFLP